jgi:hypothetical protein
MEKKNVLNVAEEYKPNKIKLIGKNKKLGVREVYTYQITKKINISSLTWQRLSLLKE